MSNLYFTKEEFAECYPSLAKPLFESPDGVYLGARLRYKLVGNVVIAGQMGFWETLGHLFKTWRKHA
jgi:hypothetical protein